MRFDRDIAADIANELRETMRHAIIDQITEQWNEYLRDGEWDSEYATKVSMDADYSFTAADVHDYMERLNQKMYRTRVYAGSDVVYNGLPSVINGEFYESSYDGE